MAGKGISLTDSSHVRNIADTSSELGIIVSD